MALALQNALQFNIYTDSCCLPGRLSKEDIEKMVRDAEHFKDEDDKQRDRLQAKNSLEGYAFSIKTTLDDDKLKDKISAEDRQKVQEKCEEVIRWIDSNQVWIPDGTWEKLFLVLYHHLEVKFCQLSDDCIKYYLKSRDLRFNFRYLWQTPLKLSRQRKGPFTLSTSLRYICRTQLCRTRLCCILQSCQKVNKIMFNDFYMSQGVIFFRRNVLHFYFCSSVDGPLHVARTVKATCRQCQIKYSFIMAGCHTATAWC